MLADKIAEELYHTYSLESESLLKNNIDYKDAEELVAYAMGEIRNMIPVDKLKSYLEFESCINRRDAVFEREAYKYAFNQGAKLILELLGNK